MGNRKFYDQMLQDAMFQQQYRITDEVDVTTLKDYMQVCYRFLVVIYIASILNTSRLLPVMSNYSFYD